jgi:hypothetical protein
MQMNSTNMGIMAQELCRAMGIDVPSLLHTLQDQSFSMASPNPASSNLSEMDVDDDYIHGSTEGDVSYGL